MPKLVSVEAKWESLHEVEVPDDWTPDQALPHDAFSQIRSHTASLVDWSVKDNGQN